MTKQYGWIPDRGDMRDHYYSAHFLDLLRLPTSIDLRAECPPVYDQGDLGSCTANAIAGALEFDAMKQLSEPDFMPSRLFIYYNERAKEGTVASDAGAAIRDGIKSVNILGACPESEWPYDITQFAIKPPDQCYVDAIQHRSLSYQRVQQSLGQMKACLTAGLPFVFGFTVYDSFESAEVAQSGIVPMPGANESVLGGHAVVAVGYDDASQWFVCRNSWSAQWGAQGYFYMPYAYLLSYQLASDFWVIKTIE
jgi:C1A family cysteine protease